MQVVYPICCGIDVRQAQLTACLRRLDPAGHVTQEIREFATTTGVLLMLTEWLVAQHCPVVAMESRESTGNRSITCSTGPSRCS